MCEGPAGAYRVWRAAEAARNTQPPTLAGGGRCAARRALPEREELARSAGGAEGRAGTSRARRGRPAAGEAWPSGPRWRGARAGGPLRGGGPHRATGDTAQAARRGGRPAPGHPPRTAAGRTARSPPIEAPCPPRGDCYCWAAAPQREALGGSGGRGERAERRAAGGKGAGGGAESRRRTQTCPPAVGGAGAEAPAFLRGPRASGAPALRRGL